MRFLASVYDREREKKFDKTEKITQNTGESKCEKEKNYA
jgi:hypothetical protein